MFKSKLIHFFSCAFIAAAFATVAQGQATRTWVSGVGDDVNPCSRTAPCKTFAGAISKTAEGGEIDPLDPAGYGAVTITKAMTLDGGTGAGWASILATGIANAINVNITTGTHINDAVVILRNLTINGTNQAPSAGGVLTNAVLALAAQNCGMKMDDSNPQSAGSLPAAAGNPKSQVYILDGTRPESPDAAARSP